MYQFALRLCSSLKRKRITRSSLLLLYLATSCFTASLAAQQIITIDYPGAVSTSPGAINNAGKVTGAYFDGTAYHGFLRNGDGTFVSFDPPGSTSTGPDSINSVGEITGLFQDASGHTLGFIRAIGGRFTIFDATDGGLYSYPLCISDLGEVSGDTTDSGGRSHGFIREGDGTITLFDPPNPSIFSDGAYYVNNGSVVGTYFDGSITADEHGYIRDAEGRYTIIDAPGATSRNSGLGTEAWKMNSSGTVIGDYWDYNLHRHGFTRDAQGNYTKIDVPGAGKGFGQGTITLDINDSGEVVGAVIGTNYKAFWKNASGGIVRFSAPGAGSSKNQGTIAVKVNNNGTVLGYYIDSNNVQHGFLRF